MNISGPAILKPNGDLDGRLTDQSIRQLYAEIERLKQRTAIVAKPATAPLHGSGPVTSVEQIKTMLQAADEHPLNVQSLLGQLAQPQIPYAPIVTVLPPLGDPQSQNGSLVQLDDGASNYTQYGFDGRPGGANAWVVAPTPPVIPTSTYQLLSHNITPVSVNANVTTAQTLMQYVIAAGALNMVGKTLRVTCYGNFDELNGPSVVFVLALVNGSTSNNLIVWGPNTPNVTKTGLPWMIRAELVTATAGVGGSMEAHGFFSSDPATTAGAVGTPNLDHSAATVGIVDFTLAQTLTISIAFSVASVSNVGRQRMMLVELLN